MSDSITIRQLMPQLNTELNPAQMSSLIMPGDGINRISEADTPEEIRKVSEDFESFFLSYMLKVMRETIPEGGLFESGFSKDIYTNMLDDAYSREISEAGGIGLADVMEVQLLRQADHLDEGG